MSQRQRSLSSKSPVVDDRPCSSIVRSFRLPRSYRTVAFCAEASLRMCTVDEATGSSDREPYAVNEHDDQPEPPSSTTLHHYSSHCRSFPFLTRRHVEYAYARNPPWETSLRFAQAEDFHGHDRARILRCQLSPCASDVAAEHVFMEARTHPRDRTRNVPARQSHHSATPSNSSRHALSLALNSQRLRSLVSGARHTVARRFARPLGGFVSFLPPPFPPKASSTTLPATPIRCLVSLLSSRCATNPPLLRAATLLSSYSAWQTPFTRVKARSPRGGVTMLHRTRMETGVVLLQREHNGDSAWKKRSCTTQAGGCTQRVQLLSVVLRPSLRGCTVVPSTVPCCLHGGCFVSTG